MAKVTKMYETTDNALFVLGAQLGELEDKAIDQKMGDINDKAMALTNESIGSQNKSPCSTPISSELLACAVLKVGNLTE